MTYSEALFIVGEEIQKDGDGYIIVIDDTKKIMEIDDKEDLGVIEIYNTGSLRSFFGKVIRQDDENKVCPFEVNEIFVTYTRLMEREPYMYCLINEK
jgi:hypothetical protein